MSPVVKGKMSPPVVIVKSFPSHVFIVLSSVWHKTSNVLVCFVFLLCFCKVYIHICLQLSGSYITELCPCTPLGDFRPPTLLVPISKSLATTLRLVLAMTHNSLGCDVCVLLLWSDNVLLYMCSVLRVHVRHLLNTDHWRNCHVRVVTFGQLWLFL